MAMSKPEVFGRHFWKVIHSMASVARTNLQRKEFKRFVEITIPLLLPCEACREHWKLNLRSKYLIEHYMGSNEQLLLFSFLKHQQVSDMLGKPSEHTPSYNEIKRLYLPDPGQIVCETICHIDADHPPSLHKIIKKTSASRRKPVFKYR